MKRIIVTMILVLFVFNSTIILADDSMHKLPMGNVVMPVSYNIATKASAFASDSGEYENGKNNLSTETSAQKAIDGVINEDNAWVSASDAKGTQTLKIKFDRPYILTSISLFVGKNSDINDFSLKYHSNGLQRDINTEALLTEGKNVARYSIDTAISAEALVLTCPCDGSICVEELEIYGYVPDAVSVIKTDDESGFYTDVTDTVLKNTLNRLCSLNIMIPDETNEFRGDDNITRAEFTKEVLNLFSVKDELNMIFNESSFSDVKKEHKYFNDIEMAVALGYIEGYRGEFRPDDDITFNEAAKILVTAAGYKEYAQTSGGYPNGYIAALELIDVKVRLAVAGDKPIKRSQAAVILDEMLGGRAVDDNELYKGELNVQKNDRTILNKYHDAYIGYGIVEAVGETTVLKAGNTSPYGIRIAGKIYSKGGFDASEYLGRSVKFIYKEINGEENKLLYMELQNKNRVLDISGEDIYEVKDYSSDEYELEYELEEKTKREMIPKAATMVYNGDVLSDYPIEYLSPENGNLCLIDNNGDGDYDIIIAVEVFGMCVHAVDYDKEIIYGLNDAVLNLSGLDYLIENKDGVTSLSAITTESVISYKKDSKDAYYIYVIDDYITGSIASVRTESGKSYVQLDESEYKIGSYYNSAVSKGIAKNLESGDSGEFYIDKSGEIVWADVKNASKEYALLLLAYEEATGECYFRIIDSMGNKILLESKNEVSSNIISGKTKPAAAEVVGALKNIQTVVQIKRTNAGKLIEINQCENNTDIGDSDWNNSQKTIFTGINIKNPFDRTSRKTPWNDDVYMLDDDGVVFGIEKDADGKIKENSVVIMPSNAYYKGTLYDIDLNSRLFGAGLIESVAKHTLAEGESSEDSDSYGTQTYESFVFLNYGIHKDEQNRELYKIKGLHKGAEREFEVSDDVSYDRLLGLSYGDVIALKINTENKVSSWTTVLNLSEDRTHADINASMSRGNWYQLNGYPSYMENGYMVIGEGIGGIPMTYSPDLLAYIYDFNRKNVSVGTASEISSEDYVLFNMYKFSLKDVLILKGYTMDGKE